MPSVREVLVDCQKVLLLVDTLEERAAELTVLEKRFQEAEAALCAALAEEGATNAPEASDEESSTGEIARQKNILGAILNVPWRVVVDAALPFLPDQALLFTSDEVMAAELWESGMLQPLPEDRANVCACWPQDIASGLLFARLPAWRLAGRHSVPENRPWLDRDVEIVVARPKSGWGK
jgi:hypothetical protein